MKIRKIRKKPKAWLFPTSVERAYTSTLIKLAQQIEKEARDFCKKWAETDSLRHDSLEDLLLKWLEELASALLFWVSDDEVIRLVRDFAHQTSDFNKRQLHKVLKSVYGVDIFKHEDWLDLQLKLFEKQNTALIKSIPTQLHEKLRYRFVEAVRKGERWESVADEIEDILAIPKKRARLIARDQIGKLNGQLTKLRQEQVGITHYIWRTMLDERVRDSHQEREGKQFSWAEAPEDGHPQQPILCRCYAEPVLPEFDDFVEGMDKPYNTSIASSRSAKPKELYSVDNTLYGNSKVKSAELLRARAEKIEPKITSDITQIIASVGGKVEGLEYRLKSLNSLERKIKTEMLAGLSEQQAIASVKDVVRYTSIFDGDTFVAQYQKMQKILATKGYRTVIVKNTWQEGATYKGINTFVNAFVEKDNIIFEMQYHTKESFELKNGKLHQLYEIFRDPKTSPQEKVKISLEMQKLSANLKVPKDISLIKGKK
ncbi:phage minor head protein [Pasteurellaceae bacterium 22721_9_1]